MIPRIRWALVSALDQVFPPPWGRACSPSGGRGRRQINPAKSHGAHCLAEMTTITLDSFALGIWSSSFYHFFLVRFHLRIHAI